MNWLTHTGKTMTESWATGVETVITRTFYPGYHLQSAKIYFEKWFNLYGKKIDDVYTPIVEDMMDDFNQSSWEPSTKNPCPNGGSQEKIGNKFGDDCYACYQGKVPYGTKAFTWPDNRGNFYHTSLPGNYCPSPAGFDGSHCKFGDIPEKSFGFILNNKFYLDSKSRYNYPIDHVEGYTLKQLEDALKNANSMKQWKENIKSKYYNKTEKYLDELFANYNF